MKFRSSFSSERTAFIQQGDLTDLMVYLGAESQSLFAEEFECHKCLLQLKE